MEALGKTPGDLIKAKVLSKAGVYNVLNGHPNADTIKSGTLDKFAKALRTSPEWLRSGRGPVELSTRPSTETAASVHTPAPAGEIAVGYVRLGLLDAVAGMGDGGQMVEYPEVIREMDFSELQIRNLIGFMPKAGRLALMTGRGTSMEPAIKPGDVVIVDTWCQHFDGDGIYVIDVGSGPQIKALQRRSDGVWVVSANPIYPPFKADSEMVIGGKVYVRNRMDRLE